MSLHDRFIKPEEKDEAWIDKFFEVKKGKGVKNYFQFAKLFYSTRLDYYSCDILYLISNFTLAKEFQEIDIQKYIGLQNTNGDLKISRLWKVESSSFSNQGLEKNFVQPSLRQFRQKQTQFQKI